jgi:predicted amidophosphoribosyltransferase
MLQVSRYACKGTGGFCVELFKQTKAYHASHLQKYGIRLKPNELEKIYQIAEPLIRPIVIDDLVTTGAHFVAARNIIPKEYPKTRVFGFFIARRALSNKMSELEN